MDRNKDRLILYAVGDVAPNRTEPASMFNHVRGLLTSGDIVFGQMETSLSRRGTAAPQARLPMRTDPDVAEAIRECGFNIMSLAGNHCMDWGREALFDTLQAFDQVGIKTCGAGDQIIEARRPVFLNKNDIRVAVLAYNSILPSGYWAESDRPGCAPMRAHTFYEQVEHDQPGTPARIHTFPHRQDCEALALDIRGVRKKADIVVVSIHWGIHFIPMTIAKYQRDLARIMIRAGADIILGHHPHILKGVELYSGKPIFYSMGNFAIEQPSAFMKNLEDDAGFSTIKELNPAWDTQKSYIMPPDTRMSVVVRCELAHSGLTKVNIIPCYINDNSEPEIPGADDPEFSKIVNYLQEISDREDLNTTIIADNGEVPIGEIYSP